MLRRSLHPLYNLRRRAGSASGARRLSTLESFTRLPGLLPHSPTTVRQQSFSTVSPPQNMLLATGAIDRTGPGRSSITLVQNRLLSSQTTGQKRRGRPQKPDPVKENVRYGPLDLYQRATGVEALLTMKDVGKGIRANFRPPGFESGKGLQVAHLLANIYGGANKNPANFVILHGWANQSPMKRIELKILRALRNGETVFVAVTVIYNGSPTPKAIRISARGSKGLVVEETVPNTPKPPATKALMIRSAK